MDRIRFAECLALLHPKGHLLTCFSVRSKEVCSFRHGWIQGFNDISGHLFLGSALLCVHSQVCSPNQLAKMTLANYCTCWGHKTDSSLSPGHCKLRVGCRGQGGGWMRATSPMQQLLMPLEAFTFHEVWPFFFFFNNSKRTFKY